MKYSIVIGTYNHLEDCLRLCVDSILKYTTLNDFSTELIIVANGCTDGTVDYIRSLQPKFHGIRLLEFPEPLGFPRAYNEGIKAAQGDYIVLFNNDNILLDQPYMEWLEVMNAPFKGDKSVGMTGPMKEHCPYADRDFILFFCAMISKEAIEKVGLLDESFSPGYGEDTDFCARLQDKGFKLVQVPDESRQFYGENRRTGNFPLYHAGNKTFANWPGGEELLRKNREILQKKYNNTPILKGEVQKFEGELIKREEPSSEIFLGKALQCDGFMSFQELEWLGNRASESQVVIEVGSWHGRSSRAIADNLPEGAKLYCVDHWDGSAVERDTNHASARLNEGDHAFMEFCDNMADHIQAGRVIPIRMSSKNAAQYFTKHGIRADVVFIDAGHTYEEVKEDIGLWKDIVKIGGVLCGHDYNYTDGMWAGVTKAVDENTNARQVPDTNIWAETLGEMIEEKSQIVVETPKVTAQPKVNIYDCFPFFNELDILDIRFAELYPIVDRFVITEATKTHAGKDKPLYFQDNLGRYAQYLDKVTHIIVDTFPALDPWSIERHQRDQLMRGLTECKDDDIIIISDADEIPRAGAVYEFKHEIGVMGLIQKLYYYKLNCQNTHNWDWAKIASFREVKAKTPCGVRYTTTVHKRDTIQNGGWHFSYLSSSTDGIIQKIEATAHQEYNLPEMKDPERIEKIVRQGGDLYNRPETYSFVEIDSSYPKFIQDNLESFKEKGLVSDVFSLVL